MPVIKNIDRAQTPLLGWVMAAIGCLLVICLMIQFVDVPVARLVDTHFGQAGSYLRLVAITAGLPLVILLMFGAVGARMFGHFVSRELRQISTLGAAAAILSFAVNDYVLKPIFGRADIQTWKMGGGAGFHFFHSSLGYASFPSGHMAIAGAVLTTICLLAPRWKSFCFAAGGLVFLALVGAQWHFLSDILAGLLVGSMIGWMITAGVLAWQNRKSRLVEIETENVNDTVLEAV